MKELHGHSRDVFQEHEAFSDWVQPLCQAVRTILFEQMISNMSRVTCV